MVDGFCQGEEKTKDFTLNNNNSENFENYANMDDESIDSVIDIPQLFKYYDITYIA